MAKRQAKRQAKAKAEPALDPVDGMADDLENFEQLVRSATAVAVENRDLLQKEFEELVYVDVTLRGVAMKLDTWKTAAELQLASKDYGDDDPRYLGEVTTYLQGVFGLPSPPSWAEAELVARAIWNRSDTLKKKQKELASLCGFTV